MLLSRDALSIRRSLVEVRTFAIAEIMKESPPVHLTHEYVATLVDSIGQKLYEQRWEIYRKAIGFGLI